MMFTLYIIIGLLIYLILQEHHVKVIIRPLLFWPLYLLFWPLYGLVLIVHRLIKN